MKELITLYNAILFDSKDIVKHSSSIDPQIIAFNRELSTLGYTLDSVALATYNNTFKKRPGIFTMIRRDLIKALHDITGASYRHAALFNKFPYDTPEHQNDLNNRIEGYIQNMFGQIPNHNVTALSCGHVVDGNLFDVTDYSACPICQSQVDELGSYDVIRAPFANITKTKTLTAIDDKKLSQIVSSVLGRQSSISPDEMKVIKGSVEYLNNKKVKIKVPGGKAYKELLPYWYTIFGVDSVKDQLSGPTDVMRIAYLLSNADADLSMTENVKFKIKGSDSKKLLSLIEGMGKTSMQLAEDFMRNRERWLRFGEHVHPATDKNRRNFPITAHAFDLIRSTPEVIPTYNRIAEGIIRNRNPRIPTFDKTTMSKLAERPGEFARRLDSLVRNAEYMQKDASSVINAFEGTVAPNLKTRTLLELTKYFDSRELSGNRIFIPKGKSTKMQIVADNRFPVSAQAKTKIQSVITSELYSRFKKLDPMGKVYIDPLLASIVMPFNKRGDSSATNRFSKGSQIPFNLPPVLRMFVHWTGLDVDLSCVGYDKNLNEKFLINWTRTKNQYGIHSGDIRDAPKGASEFIDIEPQKLIQNGIRYVMMSIISYAGGTFDKFPSFCGFMERDSLTSGKKFEPASVTFKIDCDQPSNSVIPIIFDLIEKKAVIADLNTGGASYGAVNLQTEKNKAIVKSVLELVDRKITVNDILAEHVLARGTQVTNPGDADIVFLSTNPDIIEIAEGMLE